MTNENIKKEEKVTQPAAESHMVTSTKTIDWPEFEWAIRAGETRELPVDEAQRATILANHFITKV